MATKAPAKAATKPAAKPAAAKAPAKSAAKAPTKKAAAPVEEVEAEIAVGSFVVFNGYPEGTPDEEQVLVEGEQYEVVQVEDVDDGQGGTIPSLVVSSPNPDFNPKKKVDPETNPETIEADVFVQEVTLVVDGEVEEPAAEEEPVAEEAAPAKGKAAATAGKGKGKAPVAVPPAPAKGKGKAKAEVAPEPEADVDELPDLENEDEDILAVVNDPEVDLVSHAQQLEGTIGQTEWELGGILFHIKKNAEYKEMDEGAYADNAGFKLFVETYFNFGYRKAMNLIDIYISFTQAGIEDAGAKVASMGWTKASKITKALLIEDANTDDLIELATNSTVAELQESITSSNVNVGGTKGDPVKRTILKFSYFEDEGAGIEGAILQVQNAQGLKTVSEALAFIITEYQAFVAGGEAEVADAPKQAAPAKGKAAPAAKARAKA